MKPIDEQPLMPREWLQRRMGRMVHKGQKGAPFRPTATLNDMSKWFGVDVTYIVQLENGKTTITDSWQVKLSQFFYLLDMGLIELRVDMKKRQKTWVRATPTAPPCKTPLPRIDFIAGKLRFD